MDLEVALAVSGHQCDVQTVVCGARLLQLATNQIVSVEQLVLRLPGLNMMSHNRLLFATSLAVTALAAMGLEAIEQGEVRRRSWQWAPAILAAGLGVAGSLRASLVPASLEARFEAAIQATTTVGWMRDAAAVEQAKSCWQQTGMVGACLCGLAAVGWLVLRLKGQLPQRMVPWLGGAMVLDLLYFAHGWNVQSDPALYYPRLPMLEQIAQTDHGRVLGYDCLPAMLPQLYGLRDVRGYDAVDPKRLVSLLTQVAAPAWKPLPYAALQWYMPTMALDPPATVRLPPILDMLNVRTVIFRGRPPSQVTPAFVGEDYWALSNPRAIPGFSGHCGWSTSRRGRSACRSFRRRTSMRERLPTSRSRWHCRARPADRVSITSEIPTRISLLAHMETAGFVVLADNFAVRGMIVSAGDSIIELRYWPSGFTWGFRLAGLALLLLVAWSVTTACTRLRSRQAVS